MFLQVMFFKIILVHDYIDAILRSAYVFRLLDLSIKYTKPSERQWALFASVMVWEGFLQLAASHQFENLEACCDLFCQQHRPRASSCKCEFHIDTLKTKRHACSFDSRSLLRFLFVREVRSIELCVVLSYGELWVMSATRVFDGVVIQIETESMNSE